MKTLLAAATMMLMATAAHADLKPTLPKELIGEWCHNGENSIDTQMVADRCELAWQPNDLSIRSNGYFRTTEHGDDDEHCALLSVQPIPSRKYGAVIAKFKCVGGGHGALIRRRMMGLYETDYLFLENR